MTGYELSRAWFNFCFENPEMIKPIHSAIFFFAVEHQNRLGGKEKFGFPSQMTMDAIGVKKYQTYGKALNDISDWGFISFIERSKNQYSANIISINAMPKKGKARGKALDKAIIKHRAKQGQSTGQGKDSIDKPINQLTNKPINESEFIESTEEIKNIKTIYTVVEFLQDWNTKRKEILDKPSFLNRLSYDELTNFNDLAKDYQGDDFRYALIGLFKQKKLPNNNQVMQSNPKHFLTHFNSYLTAYHDKNNSLYGKEENHAKTI